jgi:hypothetical protein
MPPPRDVLPLIFASYAFAAADASATFFFSPFSRRRLPFRRLIAAAAFHFISFRHCRCRRSILLAVITLHYVFAIC